MRFRFLAYLVALGGLALCPVPNAAEAAASDGLTLVVTKAAPQGNSVVLQFLLTNNTKARVYVLDAARDESQRAFLDSGSHFPNSPYPITGIEVCGNSSVRECLQNPPINDLNSYTPIEAGEHLALSFVYRGFSLVSPADKISFAVTLVARFTKPEEAASEAGYPRVEPFKFPHIPLDRP